jgi:hypothetical protein
MRYNLNIFYRTSELKMGSMKKNHIPFTWDEIPKFKNNDPLEIELMLGDRIIYSDPNNEKNIYNGMTAIITKISPMLSESQKLNLLTNRYLNRFMNETENQKNIEKYGGGGKLEYDIDFLLDDIEEEEIDYLNIEGKTKTKKKGLKKVERKYLLGYTTKSLILDIDSAIQDDQIIKDKVSRYLKHVFLRNSIYMIPKYVDKNKYNFENMKEWRRSNSFFNNSENDINIGKNVIRDTGRREKKIKFKKNKDLFLIEDLTLEDIEILKGKKSNNNYTQKDINKNFYTGGKLKKNDVLLNKTKSYLIKIYGESVGRKPEFFEKLLKKEDIFGLDDTYGSDLNKEATNFIINVIMPYISFFTNENVVVQAGKDKIYYYIKKNIGNSFLKQPLIRQLFIIKKILIESELLDYINKKLKTKKPSKNEVEQSINNIFQKIFFNKSIVNINVYVKFYLKKKSSFGGPLILGSSCNKRRDVMRRDVNRLIVNLGLAWNEGKTKIRLGGKTKKRKRRKKKTKKRKIKKGTRKRKKVLEKKGTRKKQN